MGKPTTQNSSFINHFSHPHGLQLTPASSSPPCSACQLSGGNSRIYSCRPCNFSLHESCSKMKQVITHPSHRSHQLNLLVAPIYDGGYFNCDGCGIIGTGFSYQCSLCDFDIHALCAYKPLSIIHNSHPQHSLKLAFESPYGADKGFSCDICLQIGKHQWLYRCIPCEFDAHVGCIGSPQPHLLQHSTSAPTPHGHHVQTHHQNSLPVPMPRSIGPMIRPNGPRGQNTAAYGPRRQSNNLGYNSQVGTVGLNEPIGQERQSFGQTSSTDDGGYDGGEANEELDGEVDIEVEYEGDVLEGEANDEREGVDGTRLKTVAYGDDHSVASSESGSRSSSDGHSHCNDLSDADLYPLPKGPARMKNRGSSGGKKNNSNPNSPVARSKNIVLAGPPGRLQGSKSPIQSVRTRRVQNAGGPARFNGPSGSNANVSGGNNNNYNEIYGNDVYVGEDNVGYNEAYGVVYVAGDDDCNFDDGGEFVDDGYGQAYDETYGESDFESYSDITGGNESMYDGEESYGTMDDTQYGGLNDEPNQYVPVVRPVGGRGMNNQNQYAHVVRPVGGQGMYNQNQYGQVRRPVNMGRYGRGGTTKMNQGAYRTQPRAMGQTAQYRPNGGPNGVGNTMMNSVVQGLCQGLAMNMLGGGGGGNVNGGMGDGVGLSIMGGLLGADSESQF